MNSADIRVALIRLSTGNHDIGIAQFESQGRTVTSAKPDTEDAILFSGFGARYSLNNYTKLDIQFRSCGTGPLMVLVVSSIIEGSWPNKQGIRSRWCPRSDR